jgi:tetrapyrrole methylase family protein/MazG family protein
VTPRVTVVGLGPGGPDLVTAGTLAELKRVPVQFVRTTRHPSASVVDGARSFDDLYDAAATIEDVYAGIVDALVAAAQEHGEVLYAVPGSPRVAERTVDLLVADERVETVVHVALSFLDLAWVRLGVDPLITGARIADAHDLTVDRGPLLIAQCDSRAALSDVKLAVDEGPTVTVLHHLGLPDEQVFDVEWSELDRSFEPDHLTSLWVPELTRPLDAFVELVQVLRNGCPWDAEQTHHTLTRHLLEETYEVLEAIEALDEATGEGYEHVEEELGDLLFQVVFHATIAAERVHRHPHVFAGLDVEGTDDVIRNWEQLKKAEKGRTSVMDGIPGNLPALLYAHKVLRKASSLGIELDGPPPSVGDDLGEQLLRLVDAARRAELDPEAALRAATARLRDEAVAREQHP